jgi:hypothetical protein
MAISYLHTIERDLNCQIKQVRNYRNEREKMFDIDQMSSFEDIEKLRKIHNEKILEHDSLERGKRSSHDIDSLKARECLSVSLQSSSQESSRRHIISKSERNMLSPAEEESKNGIILNAATKMSKGAKPNLASNLKQFKPPVSRSKVATEQRSRKVRWSDERKKSLKKNSSSVDPGKVLEAFLASDEDSDDGSNGDDKLVQKARITNPHRNAAVLYSDSEDDSSCG